MNEEQALLAAVLDDYDDDLPRLALADFWEEHGQSGRAEFVRVQVELARCPVSCVNVPCASDPPCARCRLHRHERELLNANFGAWTDGLPESLVTRQCPHCEDQAADWETNVVECRQCDCTGLVPDQDKLEFRRGFVSHVTCTAADWLEHGDAILAAQPVEEVTLTTWPTYERDDDSGGRRYAPWGVSGLRSRWSRVRHWHLPPASQAVRAGEEAAELWWRTLSPSVQALVEMRRADRRR